MSNSLDVLLGYSRNIGSQGQKGAAHSPYSLGIFMDWQPCSPDPMVVCAILVRRLEYNRLKRCLALHGGKIARISLQLLDLNYRRVWFAT